MTEFIRLEFRYLRATQQRMASVYQRFDLGPSVEPLGITGSPATYPTTPLLRIWHWEGVSPNTSSYDLAETYVFNKQSLRLIYLHLPPGCPGGRPPYPEVTGSICRVP